MITQTFKNFKKYAGLLESELGIKYDAKPYKEVIRAMLDGYCKAIDEGDERKKNLYISGLILRFWDKVGKLEATCPNIGMHGEDFVDLVYEAIMLACDYRKWQKDEKVNAEQCINQCIETVRARHYYEINLDKHKASYMTTSLETPMGDEGDNGVQKTLGDLICDEQAEAETNMTAGNVAARHLIQNFINKQKLVEAIILDIIAFRYFFSSLLTPIIHTNKSTQTTSTAQMPRAHQILVENLCRKYGKVGDTIQMGISGKSTCLK